MNQHDPAYIEKFQPKPCRCTYHGNYPNLLEPKPDCPQCHGTGNRPDPTEPVKLQTGGPSPDDNSISWEATNQAARQDTLAALKSFGDKVTDGSYVTSKIVDPEPKPVCCYCYGQGCMACAGTGLANPQS